MVGSPNVVVLIFDTLRSDYLSCYGGPVRTPHIDSVASSGVLFERAFAAGPGTPISHAALYSGQYPSENGVTGPYIDLPEGIPVIAEWLGERGYETFGITGPSKMGSKFGYDRGFDDLFEPYFDVGPYPSMRYLMNALSDPRIFKELVRRITRGGSSRAPFKFDVLRRATTEELRPPFFALSNFTTVHSPYDPPRPYKERFAPGFSRPRLVGLGALAGNTGRIDDDAIDLDRVSSMHRPDGVGRFLADPGYLTDAEISLLRRWYAAAVKYADDCLGSFLSFYRSQLKDDTVLVVTADHGEQLGEHGLWAHSHGLFDETMKVPLLIEGPGVPAGERRSDLASLVDLFDTICDLCAVDRPETTSGIPLFGDRRREAVYMEYGTRDRAEFSGSPHGKYLPDDQLDTFCAGRKAVRTRDLKLVLGPDGSETLYAVPDDEVVAGPPVGTTGELRDLVWNTLPRDFGIWPESIPEGAAMSGSVRANLEHLGYLQ